MSLRSYLILPVTILRAPMVADRYNPSTNTLRDWAHAATAWAGKGWLAPKGSQSEDMSNREQELSYSWLFLPPEAAPLATDRAIVSGDLYQMFSDPITAYTPRGIHHYEARVMRVYG